MSHSGLILEAWAVGMMILPGSPEKTGSALSASARLSRVKTKPLFAVASGGQGRLQ